MKNLQCFWILLATSLCGRAAVTNQIATDVYAWKNAPVTELGSQQVIVDGVATDFASMKITGVTLEKGKSEAESAPVDFEEMVVVREGRLKITINGEAKTVGRGSVAIVMPGDKRSFANAADGETRYFALDYRSKSPVNAERGKKAGGSFVMDWNDVKYVPHEDGKGGVRNFFSRATAMGARMDLHSTVLAPGQQAHPPHHHRAEEMIIILDADVKMYLGPGEQDGRTRKATNGDIAYLVSNEYHAIRNIGTKPALYFAFQFE